MSVRVRIKGTKEVLDTIHNIDDYLKHPVRKNLFNKHIASIKSTWRQKVHYYFNVRRNMGKPCDDKLASGLKHDINKKSISFYVGIISRASTSGSGGPVRNLVEILWNGYPGSHKRLAYMGYSYIRDRMVYGSSHPGISRMPMINLWNDFSRYVDIEITAALDEALTAVIKKRKK